MKAEIFFLHGISVYWKLSVWCLPHRQERETKNKNVSQISRGASRNAVRICSWLGAAAAIKRMKAATSFRKTRAEWCHCITNAIRRKRLSHHYREMLGSCYCYSSSLTAAVLVFCWKTDDKGGKKKNMKECKKYFFTPNGPLYIRPFPSVGLLWQGFVGVHWKRTRKGYDSNCYCILEISKLVKRKLLPDSELLLLKYDCRYLILKRTQI